MYKFLIVSITLIMQIGTVCAQQRDYDQIAKLVITQVAELQPGEVVLIRGSAESLEILEALVAATFIAGGHAIPMIDFPGARIKIAQEASMEFLLQERTADLALLESLDVLIEATPGFTSAVLSLDIPMERRIAAQDGRGSYYEAVSSSSHREVYIGQSSGVPTRAFAEDIGADFEEMEDIFWRAVVVPPEELRIISAEIASVMTAGAKVHLTGPNGTNLTFTLSDEPVRINTGRVSEKERESGPAEVFLPAGEFAACVDVSSANGVVVAPVYRFRFQDVIGLSLTFENGIVTDMSADSGGEPLREFLDTLDEPSLALSLVNIGLNSESQVIPSSSYRSWEMGGVVTVFMGDNTSFACGHVAEFRLHPQIEGLTLSADSQPVVVEGTVQSSIR